MQDIADRISGTLKRENMGGSLTVREHRIIELLVYELRREFARPPAIVGGRSFDPPKRDRTQAPSKSKIYEDTE
jgi:hypothetical protein